MILKDDAKRSRNQINLKRGLLVGLVAGIGTFMTLTWLLGEHVSPMMRHLGVHGITGNILNIDRRYLNGTSSPTPSRSCPQNVQEYALSCKNTNMPPYYDGIVQQGLVDCKFLDNGGIIFMFWG